MVRMITLHRLNKQEFILNADLIETVEATPDTLMTLTNGKKLIVRDAIPDVIGRVVAFRQLCNGSIQILHDVKKERLESVENEPAPPTAAPKPEWKKKT
jgi:flagellar protein FlbD